MLVGSSASLRSIDAPAGLREPTAMMVLLLLSASVLAVLVSRWFVLMALIVGAAFRARGTAHPLPSKPTDSTRFLFVIPAHNEAAVVAITVRSCLGVAYNSANFQVLVIADNCSDETAALAEAAGALVLVRTDLARKSKGFALEDFFAQVATLPGVHAPEAFVLVDADTSVAPDLLRAFDQSIQRGDNFVQGYYTVRNADVSWRTRLMTYAFSLANGVWLAGLDRLGLSVGLKGNGMCFRAAALERFPWQAYGLVEDMEFAWKLRLGGERVRFQPLARVYGEMVSRGGAGAASQRRRWESGRQALRSSFGPAIWRATPLSWLQKVAYQTELRFPPLGRLVVSLGFVSILAGAGGFVAANPRGWIPLLILLALDWVIFLAYALSPILIVDLPIQFLGALLYVPYYVVWKLTIGLLKAPQQWVRTPREAAAPSPPLSSQKPGNM